MRIFVQTGARVMLFTKAPLNTCLRTNTIFMLCSLTTSLLSFEGAIANYRIA